MNELQQLFAIHDQLREAFERVGRAAQIMAEYANSRVSASDFVRSLPLEPFQVGPMRPKARPLSWRHDVTPALYAQGWVRKRGERGVMWYPPALSSSPTLET